MCTSVALTTGSLIFGRNMDLEDSFGERVVVTPRSYPLRFRRTESSFSHYAMIGTAVVVDGYPLYADAVNEKGLCAAGLNFPNNAHYPEKGDGTRTEISPFELIPWVLGKCGSVEEAKALLKKTALVAEPFSATLPLTPLHWHIADKCGALVVEPQADGLHVYDDPVGVLTNNPPFPIQRELLRRYEGLNCESSVMPTVEPSFFSLGLGAVGLPGDYSSSARFARAAFLKEHLVSEGGEEAAIARAFSLLGAVAPVKGSVLNATGIPHYTVYSCCMNAERGIYYVKRADQLTVSSFALDSVDPDGMEIIGF